MSDALVYADEAERKKIFIADERREQLSHPPLENPPKKTKKKRSTCEQ